MSSNFDTADNSDKHADRTVLEYITVPQHCVVKSTCTLTNAAFTSSQAVK